MEAALARTGGGPEGVLVGTDEHPAPLPVRAAVGDDVEARLADVADLLGFLEDAGVAPSRAGKSEVERYARGLIASGHNTRETFAHLLGYASSAGHRRLAVALLEALDCDNAMEVLADVVEARHGREVRDRVFPEPLPAPWTDEAARCDHAVAVVGRMATHLSAAESRAAWFSVQHGIPADDWRASDEADRALFAASDGVDDFLDKKRAERDAMLRRLHDEDRPWYTIAITDEVLAHALADPEMEVGRREGDDVFISKIPYRAAEYLAATDPTERRALACHCPLVRGAIRRGDTLSDDICHCSLGHASHYLAGLGVPLEGEVLASAVRGDDRCRFVFHLPAGM
jgi:hypothetical protein